MRKRPVTTRTSVAIATSVSSVRLTGLYLIRPEVEPYQQVGFAGIGVIRCAFVTTFADPSACSTTT